MSQFVISKATLYRAGIGWFTAKTETQSNNVLFPLNNKSLNDFLKTVLVNIDPPTEFVQNISFDTQQQFTEFFEPYKGVTGVFDFLRGTEVKIVFTDTSEDSKKQVKELYGLLTGYEIYFENENNVSPVLSFVTIFNSLTKTIEFIKLENILSVEPLDSKRKEEFIDRLIISGGGIHEDKDLMVRIQFSGNEKKKVWVHFLTEIPAWKLTYKALVTSENQSFKDSINESIESNGVLLETWGIVDNNTKMDWINCMLRLSTENPISFNYDLSTPHMIQRPTVERISESEIAPLLEEPGIPLESELDEFSGFPEAEPMPAAPPRAMRMKKAAPKYYSPKPQAKTKTAASGESVTYEIVNPVTIKKGQSAVVLLNVSKLPGKTLLLYSEETKKNNPLRALYIKNTLKYSLDNGPITIYEDGKYQGEAMLPRLGSNDEHYIPYGLEKNVKIKHNVKQDTEKLGIGVEKQYSYEIFKTIYKHTWIVQNKTSKKVELIIKQPKEPEQKMEDIKEQDKETTEEWLIRETIPAEKTIIIKRIISITNKHKIHINNLSPKQLETILEKTELPEKTRKLLIEIQALKQKQNELNKQIQQIEQIYEQNSKRQEKIIQSLKVIKESKEEKQIRLKYISELETIDNENKELEKKINRLRSELINIDKQIIRKINQIPVGNP